MFVVGIAVMTCFNDRKDRYILPLVPIASVVAAQSVVAMWKRAAHALPDWSHWITLIVLACLPMLGLTKIVTTFDGRPWFSPALAIGATVAALAIVFIGMAVAHRWRVAMIVTPFVLMLLLQAVGIDGYAKSREGRSEFRPLAEWVRENYPDAEMYNTRLDGQQKRASVDLSIYLNRATRWIADPASLPRSAHPQIYVIPQGRNEPMPQPAPGWKQAIKIPRDKAWYVAFVRE
jgi:hypothetical protein